MTKKELLLEALQLKAEEEIRYNGFAEEPEELDEDEVRARFCRLLDENFSKEELEYIENLIEGEWLTEIMRKEKERV